MNKIAKINIFIDFAWLTGVWELANKAASTPKFRHHSF